MNALHRIYRIIALDLLIDRAQRSVPSVTLA